MACSSRCENPGSHANMGECLRAKGVRVAYANEAGGFDATAQKVFDRNLDAYQAARAQGIQPASTNRRDVDAAIAKSDAAGKAFEA